MLELYDVDVDDDEDGDDECPDDVVMVKQRQLGLIMDDDVGDMMHFLAVCEVISMDYVMILWIYGVIYEEL